MTYVAQCITACELWARAYLHKRGGHCLPCLELSLVRGLAASWTIFLQLLRSSVALNTSSNASPVHVLMLSYQAVRVLPRALIPSWHGTLHNSFIKTVSRFSCNMTEETELLRLLCHQESVKQFPSYQTGCRHTGTTFSLNPLLAASLRCEGMMSNSDRTLIVGGRCKLMSAWTTWRDIDRRMQLSLRFDGLRILRTLSLNAQPDYVAH